MSSIIYNSSATVEMIDSILSRSIINSKKLSVF